MRILLSSAFAAQLVLFAGSADIPVATREPPSVPDARAPSPSISDGALGGNEHAFLLPPIVAEPEFSGTFDPSRSPTVEICQLTDAGCNPVIASFTQETGSGSETVPAVAPDTLPDGVYDRRTSDSPVISGTFLTNIVLVVFEESSSQSARQAAVDSVDGRVIGGLRHFGDDGYYFVRLEDEHPDTPGQALVDAMELLNSLPQVSLATLELILTHSEGDRRPRDGAKRRDGQSEPGAADRDNLALVVPPVAPDTVPEGLYSSENIRRGSACITGRMLRGIVIVTFYQGTTQAEKQEAIKLVDGEVIGGSRPRDDLDGHYYVRVEDDPEGQVLCDAVDTLNSLPQVINASEELFGSAFYGRPDDEEGGLPRKIDDEAHGSVAFGSRESANPPRPALTAESRQEAPASPPDSLPTAYYVEENFVDDPACGKALFWQHLVGVIFVDGTSRAEREEAIEHVSGTVVGGVRLSEQGIYLIRVDDDENGTGVCEAVSTLNELPQVKIAGPDQEVGYLNRKPPDGPGFEGSFPRKIDDEAHESVAFESRESANAPRLVLRTEDGPVVPAVAPDTVPEGFYDEDNLRTNAACTSGRMLRGIVVLTFAEGATQAEKQEAVDLIDGDVVGGIRLVDDIEGYYYVEVEDDPDGQILCDAIEALNSLPQVGYASPSLVSVVF